MSERRRLARPGTRVTSRTVNLGKNVTIGNKTLRGKVSLCHSSYHMPAGLAPLSNVRFRQVKK